MAQITPYIIHHFQLEESISGDSFRVEKGGRYYFTFWWKSIPLGDVYIDDYNEESDELKQVILNAIQPTLDTYITQSEIRDAYKQALLDNEQPLFSSIMETVLAEYLNLQPSRVVDISVVICTRQRSEDLKTCLKSILQQQYFPKEVIVVDNAPLDDSTRKVAEQYDFVTYCLEERAGLDFARNTGAQKASYPIVAYIDDDVQLHPLWAYRIWEAFQKNDTDALTGLIIASNLETESQQIFEKHWGFNKGYVDKFFEPSFVASPKKWPNVWVIGAGANMAYRKSVLEKVQYFDERLDVGAAGCNGDSEIWYRILAAGYTIRYNPRAVVFHQHRKEMAGLHKQLFSYMRGHVAAALIQHAQNKSADYKKYVFVELPKYYLMLTRMGLPGFKFRYRTLWSEMKGLVSGIKFYNRNKNVPRLGNKSKIL